MHRIATAEVLVHALGWRCDAFIQSAHGTFVPAIVISKNSLFMEINNAMELVHMLLGVLK